MWFLRVQAFYILFRVCICLFYSSRLLFFSEYICLGFTFIVLFLSFKWQHEKLLLGVSSSAATDLYLLSLAAAVAAAVHPWGWALWLLAPIYCCYALIRKILNWVFSEDAPVDTPEALALKKKQEKMERKARAGGYVINKYAKA